VSARLPERTIPSAAAAGVVEGLLATVAMSAVMLAAERAGLMGKQPPEKIVEHGLHRGLNVEAGEATENRLAVLGHAAFGAGAGALYAILHSAVRRRPTIATGLAYGLGVWAVSYKGWVPALGIMPPPKRDRPGRPAAMIAAHVVYGATLGVRLGRP
jgi:hypothetical protein